LCQGAGARLGVGGELRRDGRTLGERHERVARPATELSVSRDRAGLAAGDERGVDLFLRLRDRAMLSVEQDTLAKAVEDVGIGGCGQERRSEAGEKKAQRHRSIH
jgi:hypothetical protein